MPGQGLPALAQLLRPGWAPGGAHCATTEITLAYSQSRSCFSLRKNPRLRISLCSFVTHSLFNHYIFLVLLPCFEAVSEFAFIPLHTTPDTAVREIDELYDVYLDVKQRWKIEVGCHICVTSWALVLSHWPHYSLFRAENLKPIDNVPQVLNISLVYFH